MCGDFVVIVPHWFLSLGVESTCALQRCSCWDLSWASGARRRVELQWCDSVTLDTFTTADREPLLGCCTGGPLKALAFLPVAGVGQEVDQEADGNSAMRI